MTCQGVTHNITPGPFLLSSVVRPGQHVGTAVVHAEPECFARVVDAALLSPHVHGRLKLSCCPFFKPCCLCVLGLASLEEQGKAPFLGHSEGE